eukprot:1023677-Pyramimonas_sp.AAC.1
MHPSHIVTTLRHQCGIEWMHQWNRPEQSLTPRGASSHRRKSRHKLIGRGQLLSSYACAYIRLLYPCIVQSIQSVYCLAHAQAEIQHAEGVVVRGESAGYLKGVEGTQGGQRISQGGRVFCKGRRGSTGSVEEGRKLEVEGAHRWHEDGMAEEGGPLEV